MEQPAQLTLDLRLPDGPPDPAVLPRLDLVTDWKLQPRTWPHAFHPLCTYLGSLPATLAHALIGRWSRPGDVVLDPFCGRGSVPLQACLGRRIGVGVDNSPLGALLSGAVLDPPTQREARDRLALLRIDWTLESRRWSDDAAAMLAGSGVGGGSATAGRLFHPATLAQLLFLRSRLARGDRTDRFLLAALAGILHGGRSSHLTDAMPNTFSLAPAYTDRWLAARATNAPLRDVLRLLDARLRHVYRDGMPATTGIAVLGDARRAGRQITPLLRERALPERVRLVITSPPYLRVVRYGQANWLRLWLLGEDPATVDAALDAPASAGASATLVRTVLDDLRPVLADDAIVVLVLGTVERDRGRRLAAPVDLAASAWRDAAEPAGYRLAGVVDDPVDPMRKLTRMWGVEAGQATRGDRLLVIAPSDAGRRRAVAGLDTPVDWRRSPGVTAAVSGQRSKGILATDAADVPPGRPGLHGPAGPHEEPGSRSDDGAAPELRAPAAGPPVRP